ncbi:MAG TPA: glycosyltransferase [Gammaproteobacteria bacterium]|nr:glycosyltransferase [Gammaproteobacteria bacterium]
MSQPAAVVHLIQGLQFGGLEMMAVNLIEGLDRRCYRPLVCCYDSLGPLAERLAQGGVSAALVPRRAGVDWRYILTLARFLRRHHTRLLHLHNSTAFFYGALAGRLARVPAIVYTEHGRDFASSRKARLINPVLARLVDRVVTVAEFCQDYLAAEGVSRRRMETIHNGIDGARFGAAFDTAALRAALGLAPAQPVIGIVARLDPIKNHRLLLKAMAAVRGCCPDAVLLIIGDGPLRAELEAQARALQLAGRVHFLGGRDDVPALLALMDVFVLCSHSEGLSLTLIEAAAAARPIVATAVGGNGEVVQDGVNGRLVPPNDPAALAGALMDLLRDPAGAQAMGQAGRAVYAREFTLDTMVRRYEALYAALLS